MLPGKPVLILSLLIALLIVLSAIVIAPALDFYSRESANWTLQSIAQDIIDLFLITPLLLITAIGIYIKNRTSLLIWGGLIFYLIYTYTIYCFALHFNRLFLVYCAILGLSFFGFVYFLYMLSQQKVKEWMKPGLHVKAIGFYLMIVAVVFYLLWLLQVIPVIAANDVPRDVRDIGLLVNPVHVIDLSVCLPAMFITGVLLFKQHNLGFILAPVMLSFCIVMDVTIVVLAVMTKGLKGDLAVVVIMAVLTIMSSLFLLQFLKYLKKYSSV